MSAQDPRLGEFGFAGDDHVVPFEVDPLDIRGRAVQLGPLLDTILDRHDYPEPVARLLAEAIALSDRVVVMSARPGRIIADVPIDLPRPRSVRKLQSDHRFHDLYAQLWGLLEQGTTGDE